MKKSMMYLIIYFTIYSILGWICECIYCAAIDKVWVNRGFLNGPVCPVYGFGAMFVILLLQRFKSNIILLFIMAVIVTTAIEYITAVILENAFHLKWWDYSNYKFNYKGRICVLNSTLFGLLSLFLIEILQPFVVEKVSLIPYTYAVILTLIIIVIFAIDFTFTVSSLVDLNKMLDKINQISIELRKLGLSMEKLNDIEYNKVFSKLKHDRVNFKNKFEESYNHFKKMQPKSSIQNRIIKAFPDMRSNIHGEQFKKLKDSITEYWNKKKN